MRQTLATALLLSTLLAACASSGDVPAAKDIAEKGVLKVHPGLVGEKSPSAPVVATRPVVAEPAAAQAETETPPAAPSQ